MKSILFRKYFLSSLYISMSDWTNLVKKVYHENHKKNANFKFSDALKEASKLHKGGKVGGASSTKKASKSKKSMKSKKSKKGGKKTRKNVK
jgi:hypothetical protein